MESVNDFFSDVRTLTEGSPLHADGRFILGVRYPVDEDGCLFEMHFYPNGGQPKITAKWMIDLPSMHEAGATHRELVQKGLDAIHEAYKARGY